MGLWGNLVSLRGLGLRDPGSNPGSPIDIEQFKKPTK